MRSASINVDLQPRGGTVWCRLPCNKIPFGRPPFSGRVPGSGASESSLSQKSSDALRAERKSPRSSSSSPLMTEGAALGAKSRELDAATDLAPRASRINGSSQRPDAYRPPSWGFGTVPTVRALCRLGWAGARSKLGGREYECAVPFSVRSRMLQLFGRSSFKCSASTHGQIGADRGRSSCIFPLRSLPPFPSKAGASSEQAEVRAKGSPHRRLP